MKEANNQTTKEIKILVALTPNAVSLANQAADIITKATEIKVQNVDQRNNILELAKKIKFVSKGLETERLSTTRPIDATKTEIMNLYREPLDRLTRAEAIIKKAVLEFDKEERRKAEALQAKLRAEAEEKARKERERLEAQALKAIDKGKEEKAEQLLEQAESVQAFAPVIQMPTHKAQGTSVRKVWSYRITDVSLIPREYMLPNEKLLGALAKSSHDAVKIPGVEFYAEESLAISI